MILRNSSTKPGMTIMLTEKDTIQFKKVFDKRHSQFAAVFSFLSNIFELRVKSKLKRRHGQQVCILCLLCLKFVGSSPLSIRNKPVTGCKKPADMLPFFIQPQKKNWIIVFMLWQCCQHPLSVDRFPKIFFCCDEQIQMIFVKKGSPLLVMVWSSLLSFFKEGWDL